MELPETIETLNKRLSDYFGLFEDNRPNYRIVWADDQREIRLVEKLGFQEVPKYYYIKGKFVLEKLIPVPLLNTVELVTKTSYEPIWVFEDRHGFPLPPIWPAIELIINTVHQQLANAGKGVKYVDPEATQEEHLEARSKRIDDLIEALFGNETEVGDALAYQQGVVVPHNYEKKQ